MNNDENSSGNIPLDYSVENFSSNSNHIPLQRSRNVGDEILMSDGMAQGCVPIGDDTQDAVTDGDTQVMEMDQDTRVANYYLNEPMLIRESTDTSLPQKIVQFYGEVEAKSPFGALAVLLKVLMNELGYIEEDKTALVGGIDAWAGGQSFRMNFVYPPLEKSSFSLLLLPVHNTLFIHGLVRVVGEEPMNAKLPVNVSDFVNSNISDDIYSTYKGSNLPKLSRTFKDCLAYPLLQYALSASGFCSKPSLLTLVSELQIAIFKYLDTSSLLRLSEVCGQLNDICKDRAIWRYILIRDFGVADVSANGLIRDWNQMYKEKYVQKKRSERDRSRVLDGLFAFPGFPHPPLFPFGGEEDLHPLHYDPRRPLDPFNKPPYPFLQPPYPFLQPPWPFHQPPVPDRQSPLFSYSHPYHRHPDLDPSYMHLTLHPAVLQTPFDFFGDGLSFGPY